MKRRHTALVFAISAVLIAGRLLPAVYAASSRAVSLLSTTPSPFRSAKPFWVIRAESMME
ncbi:MAG: hypothetical protein NTU53_12640 [Planctomycetota bacterium]|nr:hypothetical protein [Planctomycetota bacterium]